jgi:hypothetical protein
MAGDPSTLSNPFTRAVPEESEFEICPRCHRKRLRCLRSMFAHSELLWFKCDGCEHLVTRARAGEDALGQSAQAS